MIDAKFELISMQYGHFSNQQRYHREGLTKLYRLNHEDPRKELRCVLDNQQRVIQSFVESFNDFLRIFKVSKIQAQKRKW